MNNTMLYDKLIEKSKEAFLLSIEIYNKPSIKYRVEGFSFFICNAWELMLKAHLIKTIDDSAIYYSDNPDRTISLDVCIQKVFTNNKDPLRKNIEKIVELRNTSTHFIVEEYEMVYIPLFQACVFNYIEKMQSFHSIDMTELIPQHFLTLVVRMDTLNTEAIRTKYPNEIANRLISCNETLVPIINENNSRFAIRVDHNYYITKDPEKASVVVTVNKEADEEIKIVKEIKDPNNTHKFTCKSCCSEIKKQLNKEGIKLNFNTYTFGLFDKYYHIKENESFCFTTRIFSSPQYSYSIDTINFIVSEIKKDPENIIQNLKSKIAKK